MNEALLICAGAIVGWVATWWIVDRLLKRIGFDVDFWRAIELSMHSLPFLNKLRWPEDD